MKKGSAITGMETECIPKPTTWPIVLQRMGEIIHLSLLLSKYQFRDAVFALATLYAN